MKTVYQQHMDTLATRVAKAVDGERIEDSVMAMAACIAFALVEVSPEKRNDLRCAIDDFIDDLIERSIVLKFTGRPEAGSEADE